jgi:hypothetical protein
MQEELGWRSIEHRRLDCKLILFYQIHVYYNLLAINLPPYAQAPHRLTRHVLRQIHVTFDYHKYAFFPHRIILWNKLPSYIATMLNFKSQFKQAVVHGFAVRTSLATSVFNYFIFHF